LLPRWIDGLLHRIDGDKLYRWLLGLGTGMGMEMGMGKMVIGMGATDRIDTRGKRNERFLYALFIFSFLI
jgi:hypothetical protein